MGPRVHRYLLGLSPVRCRQDLIPVFLANDSPASAGVPRLRLTRSVSDPRTSSGTWLLRF